MKYEEKLIRYITFIRNQYKKVAEKRMSDAGVFQSQHHILQYLGENQCSSQKEIAEALGVSTVAITNCLKRLEEKGYIEKGSNEADGRTKTVSLSESGRAIHKESLAIVSGLDKEAFADFSQEEMRQLKIFFDRIYANLRDAETRPY